MTQPHGDADDVVTDGLGQQLTRLVGDALGDTLSKLVPYERQAAQTVWTDMRRALPQLQAADRSVVFAVDRRFVPHGTDPGHFLDLVGRCAAEDSSLWRGDGALKSVTLKLKLGPPPSSLPAASGRSADAPAQRDIRETHEIKATDLDVGGREQAKPRVTTFNVRQVGDDTAIAKQITLPFRGGQAIFRVRAPADVVAAIEDARDADEALRRVAQVGAAREVWGNVRNVRPPLRAGQDLVYTVSRDVVPSGVEGAKFLELLSQQAHQDQTFWAGADRPRSVSFRFAAPPPPLRAVGGRSALAGGGRSGRPYS